MEKKRIKTGSCALMCNSPPNWAETCTENSCFQGFNIWLLLFFLYFVTCRMSSCAASSFTHSAGRVLENHVVSVSGRVQRKFASSFLRQELTARSEGWRSLVIFVLLSPVRQRATHQGKSCFLRKETTLVLLRAALCAAYGPLFLQNVRDPDF